MDYDLLQEQIMQRFYKCNVLTGEEAEEHAWIAVDEMKKHHMALGAAPSNANFEPSETFAHLFSATGEVL